MDETNYPKIKIKSDGDYAEVYINDQRIFGIEHIEAVVSAGKPTRVYIELQANVETEVVAEVEAVTNIGGEKYKLMKI